MAKQSFDDDVLTPVDAPIDDLAGLTASERQNMDGECYSVASQHSASTHACPRTHRMVSTFLRKVHPRWRIGRSMKHYVLSSKQANKSKNNNIVFNAAIMISHCLWRSVCAGWERKAFV